MSQKTTLRIPDDTSEAIAEMHEDRGINEHKTAIRAMERGLAEYGYGEFPGAADEGEGSNAWLRTLFGEIAKALAVMGVAFGLVSSFGPPVVVWFAAASLGAACLFLLAERHTDTLAAVLGTPDTPPWRLDAGDSG